MSGIFLMPGVGYAQTALSWARIETLRNRVQLVPSGRRPRLARIEDTMTVGDALRTASASRAELRFNDGSLARIGQRATFRFTPNTRNFQLSNGTMLLLIPPGRGRTTIQTPNAVTGIQGSALFVRTIPETDTTIVGALTNNPAGPMMAYNEDGSQQQPLYAGQMVVVEGNQISQMFEFDLITFYQTSGLVEDLNLDSPNESLGTDELDEVRQEILDAIDAQEPVEGPNTTDNPAFTRAPVLSSGTTDTPLTVAFPEYEGSPAQGYSLQAEAEPTSDDNNATEVSTTTPTASINNTTESSQTGVPRLDSGSSRPSAEPSPTP
ncbi:MAG: FecR family protein, partial [Cyanobacteria bacterium P01_G01_bin.38]